MAWITFSQTVLSPRPCIPLPPHCWGHLTPNTHPLRYDQLTVPPQLLLQQARKGKLIPLYLIPDSEILFGSGREKLPQSWDWELKTLGRHVLYHMTTPSPQPELIVPRVVTWLKGSQSIGLCTQLYARHFAPLRPSTTLDVWLLQVNTWLSTMCQVCTEEEKNLKSATFCGRLQKWPLPPCPLPCDLVVPTHSDSEVHHVTCSDEWEFSKWEHGWARLLEDGAELNHPRHLSRGHPDSPQPAHEQAQARPEGQPSLAQLAWAINIIAVHHWGLWLFDRINFFQVYWDIIDI